MFDKEYSFKGKHANYVSKLTAVLDTKMNVRLFNRNLDVYLFAPLVGLVYQKKSTMDNSTESTTKIFTEQMIKESHTLKYNYRLVMLVDSKNTLSIDERLSRAFKYDNNNEKRADGDLLYNSYVLGGVEILYEKIISDATEVDDYLINLFRFITEFHDRYNMSIDDDIIYQLCKLAKD